MSGKNKSYLAVIALGLTALAVDRLYLGTTSPAKTSAAQTPTDDDQPSVKPARQPIVTAPSPTTATGVPELRFPRNLPPMDANVSLRDIFSPDGFVPPAGKANRNTSAKTKADAAAPEAIGHEQFGLTHSLGALMLVDGLKIAVISGQWLRVGETLDTCTLIRIEGESAIFECHDGEVAFSMSPRRRKTKD